MVGEGACGEPRHASRRLGDDGWMPPRVLSLCLALTVLLGCGAARGAVWGAARGAAPDQVVSGAMASGVVVNDRERPAVQALDLLRRWDARRAAAYASGEPRRLRQLYAPGSRAGARDVRLLRSYADRGLVVEELAVQVLDVRLVSASPSLVRLQVLDRMAGGRVALAEGWTTGADSEPGEETWLPAGRPESRVVTMVEHGGGWVVRSVRRG
ncbi:MAG: hypothetical protein AVDCRST_MAG47-1009 [uncultured Nocardioidaceae bacterium]|uniref:Uncharacterized protein n=1 Tax=uncultured Nocardioidaceae bacterium TaxID=253824 RepID=A0A6J4MUF1_9ACTN|nr:MAG: hypothetical protein AVDCRST_MAG47-1009 [uncultured Nocardioidaceae bacterium]